MIYGWFDICLRVEYRRRRNGRREVEGRVGECIGLEVGGFIGLEVGGYICLRNEVGWWMGRRRV